jgi:hypothetical protein
MDEHLSKPSKPANQFCPAKPSKKPHHQFHFGSKPQYQHYK